MLIHYDTIILYLEIMRSSFLLYRREEKKNSFEFLNESLIYSGMSEIELYQFEYKFD